MNIVAKDLQKLAAIACDIGWGAADILQSFYHQENIQLNSNKNDPVTKADIASNDYILTQLQSVCGQDFGYLSEETYKNESDNFPISQDWVWIIDPLDGTRDFLEKNDEYAIHIALLHQHRPVLSVVVCPEFNRLYFAIKDQGTFVKNRQNIITPVRVSQNNNIADFSIVVSHSHRHEKFNNLLANLPCKNIISIGSVGCKIMKLVEKEADLYISLSGKSCGKDWDFAPPELILTEAGGMFTYSNGEIPQYNYQDVNKWGCLISSNGVIHQEICQLVESKLIDNG